MFWGEMALGPLPPNPPGLHPEAGQKLASPGGTQRGGSQAEQRLAFTNQKGSPPDAQGTE